MTLLIWKRTTLPLSSQTQLRVPFCICKPFGKSYSTLYPDLPNVWICGICRQFNKLEIVANVSFCRLCLRRYSYPFITEHCKSCEPLPYANTWTWYSTQIKKPQPLNNYLATLLDNKQKRDEYNEYGRSSFTGSS